MKKELWLRLQQYHFDNLVPPHLVHRVTARFGGANASTKAFESKLARKLGWSGGFAHRVVGEYKKFLYLGVVSGPAVTPSRVIDQIWHEHLLFSRGYREFCRDVLQHEFDHHPELLAVEEQTSVFREQYDATLALYVAEFNQSPPADIWGTPKFPLGAVAPVRPEKLATSRAGTTPAGDDAPLYVLVGDSGGGEGQSNGGAGFGGGGGFSGGGGGSAWGDDSASGSGHGGDASDAGGSGDGGSGCSSGCGGGGE